MVFCMSVVGFDIRSREARRAVPAWLPLIPAFAIMPAKADTSSRLMPKVCAMGAAYFMVSPSISTVVLEDVAALANTSAARLASFASMPIAVITSETMSAAAPRSVAPAAAKSKRPGIAAIISFVSQPAIARYCIPSDASDALNAVVAPRSFAVCFSWINSSFVAPDRDLTALMPVSKSLYVVTRSLALKPTPATDSAMVIGLEIQLYSFLNGAVMKSFIRTATLQVLDTKFFALFQMFFKIGDALSSASMMSLNFSLNMPRSV